MDSDTKKKVIIGVSIGAALLAGIFLKNKLQETRFKPLSKDTVLLILKKARKQNFNTLKQICMVSNQISTQMKISQIDPQMVKTYLESPESPLKIQETFVANYTKICAQQNVIYSDFNSSIDYYTKNDDKEVKGLVQQCEKDFEQSLGGRLPQLKVTIPPSLTKEKLIQIQKKLSLKRYLMQIDMIRKFKGKTQQELMADHQLLKNLANPEEEQQKILEEEGVGINDEPPTAVFAAAVTKYKSDPTFIQNFQKIEVHYNKIFNKYKLKIQQNKITDDELNQLEDQLIYSQAA